MRGRTLQASLVIAILLCLKVFANPPAKVIYVDDDAVGANDGTSWQNAYNFLQDALGDARSSDTVVEIRVAQGTYKPDQGENQTPGDREATLQLINGVTLKGGYAGFSEPDPNSREITLYESILSGDLAGNDTAVGNPRYLFCQPDRLENSYHVVNGSSTNNSAILDGFTITGGNANDEPQTYGGGMYIYSASPYILNCVFLNNSAGGDDIAESGFGGAVYNQAAATTFVNCIFHRNSAAWGPGGAIDNNQHSQIRLTNCLFVGNFAPEGAGIYNHDSSPILDRCTFSNNRSAYFSGAMINDYDSHPVVTNCIFWADEPCEIDNSGGASAIVTYCNVKGGYSGTGNKDEDPCFEDLGYWDPNGTPDNQNDDFWVDGDYHLKSQAGRWDPNGQSWVKDDITSPCIDAGDPMSPIGYESFPNGGRINMGAYGSTAEASKSYFGEPICETIVAGDINGDCKVDFTDLQIMSSHWLSDNNL